LTIEFAQLCLFMAAALALGAALLGFIIAPRNPLAQKSVVSMVVGQFVFLLAAFLILIHAFVVNDFSVQYVAAHSNTLLPWYYRVSATWGGHEGSFLLWSLIMSTWMLAVVVRRANYPQILIIRVLAVLSAINLGFVCFLAFTSNPFTRLLPLPPLEGNDLNPLLQDFGLIIHPPLLYVGYVGLAVPFAFAVAGLLENKVDSAWARWARPWATMAWAFLTVGITLGSWWAYYELGWGGWWFWDPVENASFMPWLAATALIHSLAVSEKRGAFRAWSILLSLSAFSFSLLGGFIVRSGILTSVHAFAVDPERGLYILIFLGLVIGGSLTLFAVRAGATNTEIGFAALSREFFMLLNNAVFVLALTVVLWGTLSPIVYEVLTGGKMISIGPPFFNKFFVPLMLLVAVALSVVPFLNWKKTDRAVLLKKVGIGLLPVTFVGGVAWFLLDSKSMTVVAALMVASWVVVSHGAEVIRRIRQGASMPLAFVGMSVAHIGFAVSMIGVAVTTSQSIEKDLRLNTGESVDIAGYTVKFEKLYPIKGPNYRGQRGEFSVTSPDGDTFLVAPEKRVYIAGGSPMTEAGIHAGLLVDMYIALGEPLGGHAWGVRLHRKPFVRWVWIGALLMALGGGLSVFDSRYGKLHRRSRARSEQPKLTDQQGVTQ